MQNKVADTILTQLGGGGFLFMTGAKLLTCSPNSLTLKVNGKNGINRVVITLEPNDTYSMAFGRYSGRTLSITSKSKAEDVYVGQLASTFESHTGLFTRL